MVCLQQPLSRGSLASAGTAAPRTATRGRANSVVKKCPGPGQLSAEVGLHDQATGPRYTVPSVYCLGSPNIQLPSPTRGLLLAGQPVPKKRWPQNRKEASWPGEVGILCSCWSECYILYVQIRKGGIRKGVDGSGCLEKAGVQIQRAAGKYKERRRNKVWGWPRGEDQIDSRILGEDASHQPTRHQPCSAPVGHTLYEKRLLPSKRWQSRG